MVPRPLALDQHRGRHDAPHDDALQVGVLERAQQIAREREHGGNDARAPLAPPPRSPSPSIQLPIR